MCRMKPPSTAISLPGRICRCLSATADVRVNRGSIVTNVAPRLSLASSAHLKPHGWFSAGFAPITKITSAFLMSFQWLVIAPRPNVAARLATVGLCHMRAWWSIYPSPMARIVFVMR